MPRGGARPGSGPPKGAKYRPRKVRVKAPKSDSTETAPPEIAAEESLRPGRKFATSLDFLRAVWNGEVWPSEERVKAAVAALPFEHPKLMNVKATRREAEVAGAKKVVSSGRFAPVHPPKLVVNNTETTNQLTRGSDGTGESSHQ